MTSSALLYVKFGFFFLLFHFNIGRVDLMPDFVGAFFLLLSLRCQEMTEAERRLCPLWVILTVDYLVHWIWDFAFIPESLVMEVISTYAIYVLLGEVAARVEKKQPEEAAALHYIRIALTALTVLGYLLSAYNAEAIMMWIMIGMLVVLFALLIVLFKIEPEYF
jgi:hypothetical protein